MTSSGKRDDGRDRDSKPDGNVLERAFADVTPLRHKSPKRIAPTPVTKPAPIHGQGVAEHPPKQPLRVDRESNGLVVGRRPSTHGSILDTLEDPELRVQDECDLHGLTKSEAERVVSRFVRRMQREGKRWVLVVVGKGNHSPGGEATLRAHVVEALSERAPSRFILAFRTAPRRLGGTGALVLRLVDRE